MTNDDKKVEAEENYSFKDLFLLSIPMIVIGCVMVYVIVAEYTENRNSLFAKSRLYSQLPYTDLDARENVVCSNDYDSDRAKFKSCLPSQCGRYLTDLLINEHEANVLLKIAKNAFKYGSNSSISIFDLNSGVLTQDNNMVLNVFEKAGALNQPIYSESEINLFNEIRERIQNILKIVFKVDDLRPTEPVYFTQLTAASSVNKNNKIYNEIFTDNNVKSKYKNHDYSSIIYLNSHNIDFYAGRLIFNDLKSTFTVEPRIARSVLFTSGAENKHRVEDIEWGTRYELKISFTCSKN